jgi:hypothetical protein
MLDKTIISKNDLELRLKANNEEGYDFQKRRHEDWKENYTLSRNKVITNRLTQRQSVNLPLMKQIIKTLLSKIDDFVDLTFTNLDNDKQKELFYNQYWSDVVKKNNHLELKDVIDKKQVMTFGRSFEKLNVINSKVLLHIIDPRDMRVDRFVDPTDIDSARYIIQDNIFSSLSDIKLNNAYDKTSIKKIEDFYKSDMGLMKSAENEAKLRDKNEAMGELNLTDVNQPQLGETIIQLQEGFMKIFNPKTQDEEIVFTISAPLPGTNTILYSEFLETVIGETKDHFWRNHYPIESWAEDLDAVDFWSDGVADSVRTPNKIVNSWFSQTVENRTLRNYGMNYYDSTVGGEDGAFIPQSFEPVPWGWYPMPGKPSEMLQRVEIPELAGNLEEINFVIGTAEKASAATAITQGVSEQKKITLGEVELLAGNALDRIQSMSLFYKQAWLNIGQKYIKLLEAMGDDIEGVKLFKKGYRGNVFTKDIMPIDWRSESGYSVEVISKKDKSEKDMDQLQKLQAIQPNFMGNLSMNGIYKKKLLDIAGLTPDESRQILDEDKKAMMQPMNPILGAGGAGGQPMQQQLPVQQIQ